MAKVVMGFAVMLACGVFAGCSRQGTEAEAQYEVEVWAGKAGVPVARSTCRSTMPDAPGWTCLLVPARKDGAFGLRCNVGAGCELLSCRVTKKFGSGIVCRED